jgi:hypothetical protein
MAQSNPIMAPLASVTPAARLEEKTKSTKAISTVPPTFILGRDLLEH